MRIPSQPEAFRLGSALVGVGALASMAGVVVGAERMWANLLIGAILVAGVAVGAVFYAAVEDAIGANWSRPFRQVHASLSQGLLAAGPVLLLVGLAHPSLYPQGPSYTIGHLGTPDLSFVVRSAGYLVVWIAAAWLLLPDRGRRPGPMGGAPVFIIVFLITGWLAADDWLRALTPAWTSTIYGVFVLASFLVASLASIGLVVSVLKGCVLADRVSEHQVHDVARALLLVATFWMYIWFCLNMLKNYTVIPEETQWFATRLKTSWRVWFYTAPLLVWGAPLLGLLPSGLKPKGSRLAGVSALVVLGSWVNLYVLVVPIVAPSAAMPGPWELGLMIGTLGVFVVLTSLGLKRDAEPAACPTS